MLSPSSCAWTYTGSPSSAVWVTEICQLMVGAGAAWLAGAGGLSPPHGSTWAIVGYWSVSHRPTLSGAPSSGLPGVSRSGGLTPSAAMTASHRVPFTLWATWSESTPVAPGEVFSVCGA